MYIQRNKSISKTGKIYRSVLLCEKYRENGKIKTKVLSNLSSLDSTVLVGLENIIKQPDSTLVKLKDIEVEKTIDYGLSFLLIKIMDEQRISELFEKTMPEQAAILKALIVGRIITRGSKLGIYNWLQRNPEVCAKLNLDISKIKIDDVYASLSFLDSFHDKLEKKWFKYNKAKHNEVYLYDITSTYFEGTQNELSAFGYNRDKKKGKMQINIGMITDNQGFPLKIQVFEGNVKDDKTTLEQINILKEEFNTNNIIFVGDRGMKIRYNLEQLDEAKKEGIDYITGLTHSEIRSLIDQDIIQLSLFTKELAEVEHEGQRYILSVNEILKEQELEYLKNIRAIADDEVSDIKASWEKRKIKNKDNAVRIKNGYKNKKLKVSFSDDDIDNYKLRIEKIFLKRKMKKYFSITEISNENFTIDFNATKYKEAKKLAGKYVVSTTVSKNRMNKTEVRQEYKNLQNVEHAFRDLKSNNIQIRPAYHRKAEQTRGHVFLTMFCYSIIKEMENKIFPFLKTWNKKKNEKLSFFDILEELKAIKSVELKIGKNAKTIKITKPNEIQTQILKIFKIKNNELEKGM